MKILIIRFSSIGDIVLTTPVIRCLKKQLPNAEIHFLTKYSYREIIEYNPFIDVKHYLKDDLSEVISTLKKEKFDLIVDLHNNFRSWRVKTALRRKGVSFNKINFEKLIYVWTKRNLMPVAHVVDRYLETVKPLGISNDGNGLNYFIPQQDLISPEQLPLSHLHGFIAIGIGGNHNTKKLPVAKLQQLVKHLSLPIILLGGKEDVEIGESIRAIDPIKVFNACGKFSINQSASIIQLSRSVITHDTGMMHVAAAFNKKIVSIWGNTVPEFGMSPFYGNNLPQSNLQKLSNIVEVKKLWCRPCSKLGYQKCPLGHFKCMNNHDEKNIAALAENS